MKESTRQFYLASMGISMWYSREALPGAAASPVMDFSVESPVQQLPVAPAQQAPAVPRAQRSGKKGLEEVRQALGDKEPTESTEPAGTEVVDASPVTEVEAESVDRAPASDKSVTVRAIIGTGTSLNLAAEFSTDMGYELQRRLAGNLLRALGEVNVDPLPFQWPVFRNSSVPDNDSAGFEKVVASLIGDAGERPWLLLGSRGIEAMAAQIRSQGQSVWLHDESTLQGLAADPATKRALWQRLQARLRESPLEVHQR